MADSQDASMMDVTVSLSRQTLQKARALAERRGTSIGRFLAEQIEVLVESDEAYQRAERQALDLLDKGFPLGGVIQCTRDKLHER